MPESVEALSALMMILEYISLESNASRPREMHVGLQDI